MSSLGSTLWKIGLAAFTIWLVYQIVEL